MPIYLFKNPKTGKIIEVIQMMNEVHSYEENGVVWERVFTIPQTSIDSEIDPHSEKSFCEKTRNKNYTLGDLWDSSRELSEKRKSVDGADSVEQKYFTDYSKKRKGMKHAKERKASGSDNIIL